MADELMDFRWQRVVSGYQWLITETAQGFEPDVRRDRFLTVPVTAEGTVEMLEYAPLRDETGLFRTFALNTRPTYAGVRAFANRFGLLGGLAGSRIKVSGTEGRTHLGIGESLGAWSGEILAMRRLARLWEMARNRDEKGLSVFIKWHKSEAVSYRARPDVPKRFWTNSPYQVSMIGSQEIREDILARFKPGDVVEPAWFYLKDAVNKQLDRHKAPARLVFDLKRELAIRVIPESLIGCLWVQFAKAIEGNRDYRVRPVLTGVRDRRRPGIQI